MVAESSELRQRARAVVIVGDLDAAMRERVLRALPPLSTSVILCADVVAPDLQVLGRASVMPVEEIQGNGRPLEPGRIYVAPPRARAVANDGVLRLEVADGGGDG